MSGNKDFGNEFLKDGKNIIVSKKMKEIRLSRGMTQGDVAKELHIDRSVYAKYETGKLTPTKERIQEFAAIFGIEPSELERSVSAVIPDTSALLKNKRLLTMLLEDFDQVIIPDTVLEELDYQKDRGRNKKIAWQVMMTINEYRTRFRERLVFERSSHFKLSRNDAKIVELAEFLNKKLNKVIYLIHDDVRMSLTYDNSILLRDYMAKRSNNTNYTSFLALDAAYDDLDVLQGMISELDLNMYLPDGMTLIISCIRCNDEDKRTERDDYYISETKQYRKLKFLIENGADPNKTDNSRYCLTPLAHCVQLGNFRLFKLLLEMGADYNKGSVDETTPSHVVYVQLLLCEDERIFAVQGCGKNDKDALRWCIAKDGKRKSRKMSCKDFTRDLYRYMGWDPKCRYKIVGYLVDFDGEKYFAFDLTVQQIFHEKPKKGEVVTEPVDFRKGYFSENIAGTFGVPLEEHRRQTLITEDNGFVNIAMLTGDKKPGEVQLTLEGDQAVSAPDEPADSPPADSLGEVPLDTSAPTDVAITGEVRPVEGEEVPDGESNMEG